MTPEQFAALARLAGLRNSPSAEAARLHFVDGLIIAEAARQAGCSPNAANNCVAACRARLVDAALALGSPPPVFKTRGAGRATSI